MSKTKQQFDYILTIDAGTQSIRAAFIDIQGNIKDIVKTPIEPYFSQNPGWAEQYPEYYWKTLCITTKKLMQKKSVDKNAIKGVTLTTLRNTIIHIDKNGKPLRPAIVWLDQRKANLDNWCSAPTRIILKTINMFESLNYTYRDCETNWIRQNQPEIWEKTNKILYVSGYFTYKLTGELVDSIANMIGYVPVDYKKFQICSPHDLKWKIFPMDKSHLPKIINPGDCAGYITKKASTETGIPVSLPVIVAAADKACEVLGAGCLESNICCLSYGTTATANTTTKKYIEIVPFFPPYPSAIPNLWNTEVMIFRGYWMVSWFKKEFGLREEMIAQKKKIPPEVLFDELIKNIPPGSMGLTLQPYWSPGIKIPGPEAKGAIIGFGDVHTRAHIYRSILEGLAYALKEGVIRTEKRSGNKIEKIRVSGGGSQSKAAMQLTADIFDMIVEKPHTYETSALGAAIDAAVGLKIYPDFKSAINAMTRIGEIYEPIPRNRDIYQELFDKVYMKMYNKLRPLYDDIKNITGYPPSIDE